MAGFVRDRWMGTILLLLTLFLESGGTTFPVLSSIIEESLFISCEVIISSIDYVPVENKTSTNLTKTFAFLPSVFTHSSSSGAFVVSKTLTDSTFDNILHFKRLLDIHRYNKRQCAISFMYVTNVVQPMAKWMFESLTPRYVPIIRKDEDYFVFVTETEQDANTILLSQEFGNKIKYKISVTCDLRNDDPESSITLKTVNLYSDPIGEPEIRSTKLLQHAVKVRNFFADTTYNFHQKRFRVANPKAPHYFEMKPDPKGGGNIPVRGLYKVWLEVMMERFNFTIDLFQSSLSGGTGKRLKNGTWLGAVKDILSGSADMAVFIGHIYNRHEFVEWSAPLTYEWLAFITHKPRSGYSPASIFKPFPIILWIYFLASLGVICITFKIIIRFTHGPPFYLSVRKALFYLFASFMEQDSDYYLNITQLSPVRTLLAFWFLFALILSTAYRGKLVSLIAFPDLTWVPSTFEDLAGSSYRVGVNVLGKGGAAYSVLSTSKSPVFQTLFNKMEIYPDAAVCLKEGLLKNIGCIMWKSIADSTEAKNFTDKFGRKPFRTSEQTTTFIADGYVSQLT